MSQQPTHGIRLNADVWAHAASYLSSSRSLCALEAASRGHLKIVQKSTAAWRAALAAASSPSLAAAFVKAAPQASMRDLCHAWGKRWRGGSGLEPDPSSQNADDYPTLCFPSGNSVTNGDWRAGHAPRVIFDVGGEAGVMEWHGIQEGGHPSLTFVLPPEAKRTYKGQHILDRLTTSCYVIGQDRQEMIECWRLVAYKTECNYAFSLEYPQTLYHGVIELAGSHQNAAQVLNQLRSRRFGGSDVDLVPSEGVDFMSLFTYVRFEQVGGEHRDREDGDCQILDAEISIAVSEYDTVFTLDDLARLLTAALESHPAKNPNAQAAFSRGRLF